MRALIAVGLVLALTALFVRGDTLPPGPDRWGETAVMLTGPNQPCFGSPRAAYPLA